MGHTRKSPVLPEHWKSALRDRLCDEVECPTRECRDCVLDAPIPEFFEWVAKMVAEEETK